MIEIPCFSVLIFLLMISWLSLFAITMSQKSRIGILEMNLDFVKKDIIDLYERIRSEERRRK